MTNAKILGAMLLVGVISFHLQASDFVITDFGAVADGRTVCTRFIQAAIDEAHKKNGGRVVITKGTYLCGTFVLKSNVELFLSQGAILLGSTNEEDYVNLQGDYALIIAQEQQNIAIRGPGTINGRGQQLALAIDSLHHIGAKVDKNYNYRRMRPGTRPNLVKLSHCSNVEITQVNMMNAANWVMRIDKCTDLTIDGISLESDAFWNNDGIDLEDCQQVRITNSLINAADDGICLKSNDHSTYCNHIYIANNTIRSSASAIKFGTASAGGFKNITIENITIYDTFRSALAFEAVDGGAIDSVIVTNIFATNTGNAIFIKLGHRNRNGKVGTVKNVKVSNLYVQVPFDSPDRKYHIRGPELPFFHNTFPASISGLPGHDVENVVLEDVHISYPGRSDKGYAHMDTWRLDDVPENQFSYPEFSMFGELPSWGFFVRHVNGLVMKNVRLSVREEEFRPAYVFDDVKNITVEGGSVVSKTKNNQLAIRNVKNAIFKNIIVDGSSLTTVDGYGENENIAGVKVRQRVVPQN